MTTLLRPDDLKQIAADKELAKMKEEQRLEKDKAERQRALREVFMSRDIHPDAFKRINDAVLRAAENGFTRLEVVSFPASFCTDGGRRINNALPDWPDSLDGFAKRAYDFYIKELRPLGYKLHAEVTDFPGGVPGEITLVLRWG